MQINLMIYFNMLYYFFIKQKQFEYCPLNLDNAIKQKQFSRIIDLETSQNEFDLFELN